MEIYFIKSVTCLAIFLLFYKLLLEKENMHVFKRFYLLTAMLAAVAIPFITFTNYVEPSSEYFQPLPVTLESSVETSAGISEYLEIGLWIVYVLGVLFFSIKFCRNFCEIVLRIKRNPKVKEKSFVNVLLAERMNPHTFFSYIFLNRQKYEKQEIPKEVIIHEQAHSLQKHSFDILLVELAQIIFWFNPLLFLLKDAIKLNHEFLADDSVLRKGTNPSAYQKTLLSYSSGGFESGLVNSINYSSIKKRFTVMKTRTSKTAVWARSLLVLPLLAVLVYGFSTKEMVVKGQDQRQNLNVDETSNVLISENIVVHIFRNGDITVNHQTVKLDGLEEKLEKINPHLTYEERRELTSADVKVEPGVKMGIITDIKMLLMKYGIRRIDLYEAGNSPSSTEENEVSKEKELEKENGLKVRYNDQEKATPEMIREYNKMAKYYNSRPKDGTFIKKKDYERMQYIYGLMTPEQKKNVESFPVPSPPPPPNQGMVDEYNKLAKFYNEKNSTEEIVQEEDFKRMLYIFKIMTDSQRKNAEKLPPPPVPAPEPTKGKGEDLPVPPTPPAPPRVLVDSIAPPPPAVGESGYPTPPPPPPPITFEELVAEGATFFYNGKLIAPEKARNMVEVQKNVNVEISSINDEKPVVRLTDKKNKN